MTARTNVQAKIKWALRWGALLAPLVLCSLLLTATTSSQQESDRTRRSWDKQFEEARAKARGQKVAPKTPPTGTRPQTATQPKPSPGATKPAASPAETADDELIGITFWRLRPATSDNSGQPRLSVEQRGVGTKYYRLERADAETPFREGEMVRFSVETTRADSRYLYVVDREVYADQTMGEPYLLFPARSTPPGGNVIAAGKLVYVPAQGDPLPYFTLQRKRPDHVGEMLTIILSPEPLPLAELPMSGAPLKLDAAVVKQWEQQWGGPTERREARKGAGKAWTKAEQEAGRGQGVLAQGDPLPQTIYRVKGKVGRRMLVALPLKIEHSAQARDTADKNKPQLVAQLGHDLGVAKVALSADGKYLVTTESLDKIVILWEVASGRELRRFQGHSFYGNSIALSADGKYLATGSDDNIARLWEVASGRELRRFQGHSFYVNSIALSADGKYLATGSDDMTARLWEVKSGRELRRFEGHSWRLTSVALSANGRYLATGSYDKTARIWEVASGRELRRFKGHSLNDIPVAYVSSVVLSSDGKYLVTGYHDTAQLWNVDSGRELRRFDGHPTAINSVVLSADGKYLVTETSNAAWVWEVASGHEVRRFATPISGVSSVTLSADGKYLVTGSNFNYVAGYGDSAARLWEVESGRELRRFGGYTDDVSSVALSADGKYLVTGGGNRTARIWEVASGREMRRFEGLSDYVTSVALSADGKYLVTGCRLTAQVWEVTSGREVRRFENRPFDPNPFQTDSVALSADGKYLMTGGDDARLWDVASGRELRRFEGRSFGVNEFGRLVTLSADGKYLIENSGKTARLREAETGRELRRFEADPSSGISSVKLSADEKYLVTGNSDGKAQLWDVASGRELRRFEGHAKRVTSVGLSADGRYLVTGSRDSTTRFWDVATGKELCSLISFRDGSWAVVAPDGRFDASSLEQIEGLHWIAPDEPMRALPLEIFMRDYYEPSLLPRILGGKRFKPIKLISGLNRLQPEIRISKIVLQPETPDLVSVTIEVANTTGTFARDGKRIALESGVHDLRLFRDGQLIGYAPEQDGPIKLESGKATITFKDIKLPRRADLKQVEFSAYAFNVDRVKSETARKTYVLPRPLPAVKGRAYVIAVGVNAYENAAFDLNFAANDARRLQSVLTEKLKATGEYAEVVPITLLSDYEWKDGRRTITAEQATKGNVNAVLGLLAGRQVDPVRLVGIANADKLRQARPEDLVILSFASHGYADEAGQFYFVTYDTGPGSGRAITPDVLQKSISSDELSRWLRDVDAGGLVMIVDACQSAAAVEGEGFKPGPMGSRGLGQLAYDKGMRILAATQADNAALEHGLIRQGLLTYALVRDGIELGRADFKPEDKTITLGEWLEYARDRVPQLFAEIRSGQVRSGGPAAADMPKVILLPQKNAQPNQAGATRLFLQGKPIGASGNLTLAEEQIQQPALFDYARKRRDVLLLRK